MVTSGQVNGDVGSLSDYAYISWQLASQNTGGNYSVINWQVRWHFPTYSCRGLRLGSAHVNGTLVYQDNDPGDGVHAFNSSHNHSPYLAIAAGQINVPHNTDGTKTFTASVSITGWESGPTFISNGSGSFSLPTIQRAPSTPGPIMISVLDQTRVHLEWLQPISDVDYFVISYGTTTSADDATVTSGATLKTITGLSAGVKYYFKIKAVNAYGESAYNTTVNATTIAGSYILNSGVWTKAAPYVNDGGTWKLARPYAKSLGVWHISTN